MCKPPEIGRRIKITHFHTRHRVRPWVGHSYDEQFFSCTYVKEVMTDQPPKGPVVYSLRNGNAHYIGATVDLDRRIKQHNAPASVEPIAQQREVQDGDALGM